MFSQDTINQFSGALISLVSVLLTIIVSHFLQGGREKRARKWDLEDRQTNRRLEAWGERIKEVREIIDTLYAILTTMAKYERDCLLPMASGGKVQIDKAQLEKNFKDVNEQLDILDNKSDANRLSILILNDSEITDMLQKLRSLLVQEGEVLETLSNQINAHEALGNDISAELERISKFDTEGMAYIIVLKMRLDELAEIYPPAPPRWRQKVWHS